MLIQVTIEGFCFGVSASSTEPSFIVDAAPCSHWAIGRRTDAIISYWKKRGAIVKVKTEFWEILFEPLEVK